MLNAPLEALSACALCNLCLLDMGYAVHWVQHHAPSACYPVLVIVPMHWSHFRVLHLLRVASHVQWQD